QLGWCIVLLRPALAMAFLGWPSGRPTRRIRNWIVGITATWFAISLVLNLFNGESRPNWPDDPLAPYSVGWVARTLGSGVVWVFMFTPALAAIIVMVRQRRALPTSARRLVTPVTVTGIIVFGTDLVAVVLGNFGDHLIVDDATGRLTVIGVLNLVQNYVA